MAWIGGGLLALAVVWISLVRGFGDDYDHPWDMVAGSALLVVGVAYFGVLLWLF